MRKIGLWHVTANKPVKIKTTDIDLEKNLEDWIEEDPELLQAGLTIIGRQVKTEAGYLDLLALDPQARLIIIENKRGIVTRDTIAQILDYASCVGTMSADDLEGAIDKYLNAKGNSLQSLLKERDAADAIEKDNREILFFVVGTGRAPGLERITNFLSQRYQMPISFVTFDVFQLEDGKQILARELTEPEYTLPPVDKDKKITVDEVIELAEEKGIGEDFRKLYQAAEKHGLYPRPYKTSIMYTPPNNRTRMLFTVWTKPKPDGLNIYVSPKAFSEFYPVTEKEAEEYLGEDGWKEMDRSQVDNFIAALEEMFSKITANE